MLIARDKGMRGADGAPVEARPIYLVPQLCHETGLPDSLRKDFKKMQDFDKYMRMEPEERKQKCTELLTDLNRFSSYQFTYVLTMMRLLI